MNPINKRSIPVEKTFQDLLPVEIWDKIFDVAAPTIKDFQSLALVSQDSSKLVKAMRER